MKAFLYDYTLLDELGKGAYASVYKVKHNKLEYIRAVRVLNQTIAKGEDDPLWQKFLNECKILLRLGTGNNPYIVHVYQPLLRNFQAFVEMDFIDGENLHDYLNRHDRFIPIDEVVRLAQEMANALSYCHHDIYKVCMNRDDDNLQDDPEDGSRVLIDDAKRAELVKKYQVIHNDLHSGNIMRREDGGYVLLDFGLSIQNGDVLHSSRVHGGAPEYKAPEKWENEAMISCQTDIFSFGVILYEFLTGNVPFCYDKNSSNKAKAEFELSKLIQSQPTPPIFNARKKTFEETHPGEVYTKDYPDWLERLIMKCLEKQPEKRFASGRELYDFVLESKNSENKPSDVSTGKSIISLQQENDYLRKTLQTANVNNQAIVNKLQQEITRLKNYVPTPINKEDFEAVKRENQQLKLENGRLKMQNGKGNHAPYPGNGSGYARTLVISAAIGLAIGLAVAGIYLLTK